MKKVLSLLKYWHQFLHYLLTAVLTLLFLLFVCIFIFIVLVKVNPRQSEKMISQSVAKITSIFNVQTTDISTKIDHGIIKINIKNFAKHNAKIVLIGNNTSIEISLQKLWQGTLYKIEIDKFVVRLHKTNSENHNTSKPGLIPKYYYSIIPSFRMFIKDLALDIQGNVLSLQNAKLSVNEMHYVLSIQAYSIKDKYKLSILLDNQKLYIYFNGITSSLLHRYTNNEFGYLDFESISGDIIVDVHDINNIKYNCTGNNIKILKGQFVAQDLNISLVQVSGSINNGNIVVNAHNIQMPNGTEAKISFISQDGIHDIDIGVQNINMDIVKSYLTDYILRRSGVYSALKYLTDAINNGFVPSVSVKMHLPIKKQSDLAVNVKFENTSFLYNKYFPQLYEASGTVEVNSDYTTVDVKHAKSGNNIIKNSRAVFHHYAKYLSLDLLLEGVPSSLANTFNVSADYSNLDTLLHGDAKIRTFIGIDLTCSDVYACTKINGHLDFSGMTLPFTAEKISGTAKVIKEKNKDMVTNIVLDDFQYQHFNIKEITASHALYTQKGLLELKNITVRNSTGESILGINLFKIPFKEKPFIEIIDIPLINFNGNNFGIKVINKPQEKSVNISGKSLSVPVLFDIWKDFNSYINMGNKNAQVTNNSIASFPKINFVAHIDTIYFFNNIGTFLNIDITHTNNILQNVNIDSKLITYHYHNPRQYIQVQHIKQDTIPKKAILLIPDLHRISLAINKPDMFKSGVVTVYGEYNNDSSIEWNGDIASLNLSSDKFNFKPKQFHVKALLKDSILSFKNIKMYDKNHTIFITGHILTDVMQIKSNVYYTPSKIELLNNVPIFNKAISVTTLGQNHNGLVSLEFDVYGNLFTPDVKFNKASPIKSLWKFSFGVLLLPLFLL